MYHYKNLKEVKDAETTACLNLAFSDYALPIRLTEEQLQALFSASGVDKELSYGAFLEGKMVGFILNSCSSYQNRKVVFDVGTGVVPEHRGRKIFTNLFAFAEQELLRHGVERYYLEVLQQNDKAISAYKKQGFFTVREFYVLKSPSVSEKEDAEVEYEEMKTFDFSKVRLRNYVQPSYEHSTEVLKWNPELYAAVYRKTENITALCMISKGDGRILQMAYDDICELKRVVQGILARFGTITVKNIDGRNTEVLEMFYSMGFTEAAKQFEMAKDLKAL